MLNNKTTCLKSEVRNQKSAQHILFSVFYLLNSLFCLLTSVFFLLFTPEPAVSQISNISTVPKQTRIVGGSEAIPGAYPWMASIARKDITSLMSAHICGGSLIHPKWVVTAAHCVCDGTYTCIEKSPQDIQVVLGVHDLNNPPTDLNSWARIDVKKIVIYPTYDHLTTDKDIALLELAQEVSFGTLEIYAGTGTLEGSMSTVIGWGATSENGSRSPVLLEVFMPVVSNQTCNEAYNNYALYGQNIITDYMLCSGFDQGLKDACYGDSGGPMVIRDNETWKLGGIVSWGGP